MAQQFCVVTGLRFGNLPFIPIATNENCSLKRKYFCNNKTVSLLELEKAFLDCANEEDVFKLGFLNFAIFVLLGSEKHVHIGKQYLKFAEDLEEKQRQRQVADQESTTSKIWAFEVFPALVALHFVVHKENAHIPRILQWMSNSLARFHELMSQVFENSEVDVQLLHPSVIDKQQPYWTWENDYEFDETVTLPSSSKCVEDFGKTLASIEHYFKLEIEQLKKRNGGLNERGEGHEDLGSPHMNEGGDNDMSPLHEYVAPTTEPTAMEAQVLGDGAEAYATIEVQEAKLCASVPHIQVQ
ncbi:unnamed protein product [Prunus armeniaca]